MFLWFTHWVKLLLFSDKNWILAPFYLSRGCLSQIELNWSKYFQLLLGLCFKMFFRFTYWVKQLLLSGLNWIIATLYLARSCLGYMGLDLAKIGPISIRTKLQIFLGFTYWVLQLLFSGLNWILAPSYLSNWVSMGCLINLN